jgi:POT family proton-dependent oligopeptide transporter
MANHEINAHIKHPAGLWYTALSVAFYCFAFGGINSLLVLYARDDLQIAQKTVYTLFAAYNSLLFTLPLLGGFLSGKFGYKNAYGFGLLFCFLGCATLATIHTATGLYWGLASFAVGVGLAAPSSYCLVGALYAKQDARRESGYTLFYMVFNIGFALAAIIGGYASAHSYASAFWIDAVGVLGAALTFFLFSSKIKSYEGESLGIHSNLKFSGIMAVFACFSVALLPICAYLFKHPNIAEALLWTLVTGASLGLILLMIMQREKVAKQKILAFFILSVISIAFWTLYALEPSLVTVFVGQHVERYGIPTASFYSLNPIFIIIFGLLFGWLWRHLNHKGKNLSLPTKFAASLFCVGSAFLILYWCTVLNKDVTTPTINPLWIVLAYMFFTIGELLISPIGLSMVGRLAPAKKEGLLMGVWQLFTGFSAVVSGYAANMTTKGISDDSKELIPMGLYQHSFFVIGISTVAVGFIAWMLVPKIKQLLANPQNMAAANDDA